MLIQRELSAISATGPTRRQRWRCLRMVKRGAKSVCLNRGLEQAVQDPTYWPIMYHAIGENYQLIDMIHLIPADVYQRYQDKSFENTEPNRTYCSNIRCSAFIPPSAIEPDNRAPCPKCLQETCAICKSTYHVASPACSPEISENDKLLRETAQHEGWQQCPTCFRHVELYEGCEHITYITSSLSMFSVELMILDALV
jgi:hypothetical protein